MLAFCLLIRDFVATDSIGEPDAKQRHSSSCIQGNRIAM